MALTQAQHELAHAFEVVYQRGRSHERLDIVDFINHPPGRIPEWVQGQITEIASAIKRGAHTGCASRLYADQPTALSVADEDWRGRALRAEAQGDWARMTVQFMPESDPTQVAHLGEMPSQPTDLATLGLSAESIAEIEQLPGESKRLVLSAIGQTSRPTVRLVVTVSGESPDANWYDAIIPAGLPDQVHRLIAAGLLFDARWSDVAFTFIVEAV